MVGEDPEVKFADVMAGFIGKPFRPGGTGPDGYDCIGLCWAVLRALGRDVPAEYAGWSVERGDYAEWAAADRAAADALVREMMENVGDPVAPLYELPGDLLLVDFAGLAETLAVYCGNGVAVTSTPRTGVRAFNLSRKMRVVAARRFHGR